MATIGRKSLGIFYGQKIRAAFGFHRERNNRVFGFDEGLVFQTGDEVGDGHAEVGVANDGAVVGIWFDAERSVAGFGYGRLNELPSHSKIITIPRVSVAHDVACFLNYRGFDGVAHVLAAIGIGRDDVGTEQSRSIFRGGGVVGKEIANDTGRGVDDAVETERWPRQAGHSGAFYNGGSGSEFIALGAGNLFDKIRIQRAKTRSKKQSGREDGFHTAR